MCRVHREFHCIGSRNTCLGLVYHTMSIPDIERKEWAYLDQVGHVKAVCCVFS